MGNRCTQRIVITIINMMFDGGFWGTTTGIICASTLVTWGILMSRPFVPKMDLNRKTIIITGGSSGIGKAIAKVRSIRIGVEGQNVVYSIIIRASSSSSFASSPCPRLLLLEEGMSF